MQVVLKQDSNLVEHYYGLLQPWEHYVPVARNFSDLESKIEWLQRNDGAARAMVRRANAFAREHLVPQVLEGVWLHVFQEAATISSPHLPPEGGQLYAQQPIACKAS
jgi:hypothetical protein